MSLSLDVSLSLSLSLFLFLFLLRYRVRSLTLCLSLSPSLSLSLCLFCFPLSLSLSPILSLSLSLFECVSYFFFPSGTSERLGLGRTRKKEKRIIALAKIFTAITNRRSTVAVQDSLLGPTWYYLSCTTGTNDKRIMFSVTRNSPFRQSHENLGSKNLLKIKMSLYPSPCPLLVLYSMNVTRPLAEKFDCGKQT